MNERGESHAAPTVAPPPAVRVTACEDCGAGVGQRYARFRVRYCGPCARRRDGLPTPKQRAYRSA